MLADDLIDILDMTPYTADEYLTDNLLRKTIM
jgi:hypothetical protein